MKYELKYIQPSSIVLSSLPVVLFLLGLLGGLLTFVILPNPNLDPMAGMTKLMATGLFSLLYMFLMIALLVVVAFLYNLFTQTIGLKGVRIEVEEVSGDESETEGD